MSRPNFIELCERLTREDEKIFEQLWRTLGLSVDWSMTYATIGKRAQRVSQLVFLHHLKRGLAYQVEAPTLWDIDFKTAVAQAELEDREMPGAYHRIKFKLGPDRFIEIDTTRPELIPACVALVAHPDDARYQPLFGKEVETPLFGVKVPVRAHTLADPEKGSGIAMICTFGDITDVTWWRELSLPVRAVIQADGTLRDVSWNAPGWESTDADRAQRYYAELKGLSAAKARVKIVEQLRESGDLVGEPRPITHAVKFYEKGDRPLEIVTSRQWFIKTIEFREALIARGKELKWHPEYMETRFENWANGLNGDWCVSRQRFFGVPFPVWYPLDAQGRPDYDKAIPAREDQLPVDPSTDVPSGYRAEQRGVPGGFAGDPDVMDTWATSSVSPQIVCGWPDDQELFKMTFPMDLRPAGARHHPHLAVRLGAARAPGTRFAPLGARGDLRLGARPRPQEDVEVQGQRGHADGAARGARIGRRALLGRERPSGHRHRVRSRPDEGRPAAGDQDPQRLEVRADEQRACRPKPPAEAEAADVITAAVDRAMVRNLAALVTEVTAAFEGYDYARVLQRTETFFWGFCDDYLELVKGRRYGEQGAEGAGSANAALTAALSVMLRLFAPFLPFVTEEVWSWWREGSIHKAAWPTAEELTSLIADNRTETAQADQQTYDWATEVLFEVRKQRSEAKQPLKVPITKVTVKADAASIALMPIVEADLRAALRVQAFDTTGRRAERDRRRGIRDDAEV